MMPELMDQRIRVVLALDLEMAGDRNPTVIEACQIALRAIDAERRCRTFIELSQPSED